jgi:ABC-type Fe3+-hydroxamate transport system substrate-binding protein
MEIFDIEETPTHGGSIRIYVRNNGVRPVSDEVARILRLEEEMLMNSFVAYDAFAKRVHKLASDFLEFVLGGPYDQKIISYGAAAKGNTLLNYCGIKPNFIQYAVDRSPHKQGLFLPGSHIEVVGEEALKKFQPDYILITARNLADEIMEQLKYIRIWDGRFVIPIPELRVI